MMLALIFSASPLAEATRFAASADSTTKAKGSSPLYSSGIPTTQAQHPDAAADVLLVLQGRLGTPGPSGFPERTWLAWDRRS